MVRSVRKSNTATLVLSRRWRGGQDSAVAETRRENLIHYTGHGLIGTMTLVLTIYALLVEHLNIKSAKDVRDKARELQAKAKAAAKKAKAAAKSAKAN